MRAALSVTALVLCMFELTRAQTLTGLKGRQYRYCPCSPTTRGYRVEAYEELLKGVEQLHELITELKADPSLPASAKRAQLDGDSQELWAACTQSYNTEECVNADAALRVQAACSTGTQCASFCEYDRGTWKNNGGGYLAVPCDTLKRYRSFYPPLEGGDFPPGIRPSARNPDPGPEKRPEGAIQEKPTNTATTTSTPAAAPTASNPQNTTTSNGTSSLSPDEADLFEPRPPPTRGDPNAHEGCVAVEHLRGYRLQHRVHLLRPVLCYDNFCATPNHALIVDGQWTSMKYLCSAQWSCVRSVKQVNNLDAFHNRRAQVGQVTITPYDLRFPRAGVFLVQALEKLLYGAVDCLEGIAAHALTLSPYSF